jgi:hypothetical protein
LADAFSATNQIRIATVPTAHRLRGAHRPTDDGRTRMLCRTRSDRYFKQTQK